MRDVLTQYAAAIDAFEPDAEASAVAATRGYEEVFQEEPGALKKQYDLIGLFDVLEHIEDDQSLLARLHAALTPEGRIVLTVPAFMSLWSVHDVEHHHFRRYTRASLTRVFRDAGFELDYVSYWNSSLSIPAALLRRAGKSGGAGLTPPRFVNAILNAVVTIESWVLARVPLPFGLSVVAVARKAGASAPPAPRARLWLLARYTVTGVSGGLIQIAFLYLWVSLLGFRSAYLLGTVFGFIVALVVTFLLQKYWTFRDAARTRMPLQLASYSAVALSGLLLNALLLALAKRVLEQASVDFFNGWYLVAQAAIVVFVSLYNFVLNYQVTFRQVRRAGIGQS